MMSFAVIGYPLVSTLSPAFYNHLFELLQIQAHYTPLRPLKKNLPDIARQLRDGQLHGINITLPYKSLFIQYLDEISPDASPVGAVNCVTVKHDRLTGHNTDVTGIHYALKQHNVQVGGSTVLVVGAGGAARATVTALLQSDVAQIHVAGRKAAAVTTFVDDFQKINQQVEIEPRQLGPGLDTSQYALIVNATPVGMWPATQDSPLQKDQLHREQVVFDLVYNPEETLLLRWALDRGCSTISGLDMFIVQALASLENWFPNTVYTHADSLKPVINLVTMKTFLKTALINQAPKSSMVSTAGETVQ